MKIFQLIQQSQLRGAEVFASQLGEHLNAMGHECKLVTLFGGDASLPFSGEIVHLNRPRERRLWDWSGWKTFAELVSNEKPDIIQANAGDTLKFAVFSKLMFNWKIPIVFRNASTISKYINSRWVLWFNQFLFRQVSAVISVSQFTKNDFVTLFSSMKSRVSVIPVGIEMNDNVSSEMESGYLLHVGGFTFEKNHKGLLRIMKRVVMANPKQVLWLVGDGPLRSKVEKEVEDLGLNSNVRFFGYQEDVLPFMRSASALLLPSVIEGLPAVILEAMYCRAPVVAYNVGGVPEVVKHGETGILVPAGNEERFGDEIQDVLLNPNLTNMKNNAYNQVVHEFDNRVIASKFQEIYQKTSQVETRSKKTKTVK